MRKFSIAFGALGFGLIVASCSDNITNNYYETPNEPRVDTLVILDTIHSFDTIYSVDTVELHHTDTLRIEEQGLNGLSAYEIAVKNGYKGTEEEWAKNTTFGYVKDDRDDLTYKTVRIGNQVWMAENMNYRVTDKADGLDSASYCVGDDPANCNKFGRLYSWSAAKSDACMDGWHLPSEEEWNTLFEFVGGSDVAGVLLRSVEEWRSIEDKSEEFTKVYKGVDAYGFSVLPYDVRNTNNAAMAVTIKSARYWTGTKAKEGGDGMAIAFSGDRDAVTVVAGDAENTYAVRCIKTEE